MTLEPSGNGGYLFQPDLPLTGDLVSDPPQ
jgi:hypothetical protein